MVTDDRFQIASSMERNKVNGVTQVTVSGMALPARVGLGWPVLCLYLSWEKTRVETVYPRLHFPSLPIRLLSRFCEEEVDLVPRHPSPPHPDCRLIV